MTRQRHDKKGSTEFSQWLRKQKEIASEVGYCATDIDYMWENYQTGEWMLLEEKRRRANPTRSQCKMFEKINDACLEDSKYRGIHLIQFENTNPEDGRIWIDRKPATKKGLFDFLKFIGIFWDVAKKVWYWRGQR